MFASHPVTRLPAPPSPSGAPPAACGNQPARHVQEMERGGGGDMEKLYAHAAQQPRALQTAFIDGSEALRDYLGIGNPDKHSSPDPSSGPAPRIAAAEAPAALAMAATCSANEEHVQRALARLDEALATPPSQARAMHTHQQCLETVLGTLLHDLHTLPTEAAQQQAVELIMQRLLPQLHAAGRARIAASARGAMVQRGIGGPLKERLHGMFPAPRSDSRGRAGFEAALRQRAFASAGRGKTATARSAGGPSTCPGYGPFNKAQVQLTSYARQAAELLIDDSGKLTGTHIAGMLDELHGDETLLAEHKSHMIRTLAAFQHNGRLAATINSVCEDKPLKGGAADVVRATLNVPPDRQLTEADARKAVVMSLLGYLRQGKVGSCFVTGPAICLLDSAPETVANDLKELLEDNKLTFSNDNTVLEVPLNKHVQDIHAQNKVWVKEDGTTLTAQLAAGPNGTPALTWQEDAKLQDTPGMRAALTALGIPEGAWQAAISAALQRMGRAGVDSAKHGTTFAQIIRLVAGNELATRVEPAQHAFIAPHRMVTVSADGRMASGGKLQDLPGVQAALTALGVPADRRHAYVTDQLAGEFPDGYRQVDLRLVLRGLVNVISHENRDRVLALAPADIGSVMKTLPNGRRIDGVKLQDIPIIKDALNTLCIPGAHRQEAIASALQRALLSGIDPVKQGISSRQIIEQLVTAYLARIGRLAIEAFRAKHSLVKVNEDGVLKDGSRLQDHPGIQAALGALGIPETSWETAIRDALKRMIENNCKLNGEITFAQIIAELAADPQEIAELTKNRKNALRAFNGAQEVGLLRTWEFTLAGASQLGTIDAPHASQWNLAQVSTALFVGEVGDHERGIEIRAPGLNSLHDKTQLLIDEMRSETGFEFLALGEIRDKLFSSMESIMKNRFIYEMDMNILGNGATDGVSTHGGFVLYEKVPADDPSRWKRIDNANAFMDAIQDLIQDAITGTRAGMGAEHWPDDPELEALEKFAECITASVNDTDGRNEFLKHAVLLMNVREDEHTFSMDNIEKYARTPWKKTNGSFPDEIAARYGSVQVNNPVFGTSADRIMTLMESFCAGLANMASELQAKAAQAPDGFKIPAGLPGHIFTLMPMEMKEIWSSDPATRMTAKQWVFANVWLPAAKWHDEPRTMPALSDLLKSTGSAIGASDEQVQEMVRSMSEEIKLSGQADAKELPYTPKAIHDKLSKYCGTQENGDALLTQARQALTAALPIPAKVIADTNWMSVEGRPVYMGILYNPFTDRMDAQCMHQDGSGRKPVPNAWTEPETFHKNHFVVYTPMTEHKASAEPETSGRKRKFDDR